MDSLVVAGASGHARVIASAAQKSGKFSVLGYLDNNLPAGLLVDGLPILGGDDILTNLKKSIADLKVIVGIGDNALRQSVAAKISITDFATVVHPNAVVADDVQIGDGSFVAASATINVGVRIGCHVIVNTSSSIDHDCDIADFSSISPGAILTGGVSLRRGAMIGAGAVISPNLEVGQHAVVGAGTVVIRSLPQDTCWVGVPARQIAKSPKQ
ncbi:MULTISPECIES: acetyltransferase [Thalassospira]|uniref:PglD N-terminal domain-containing protein n=2 Tax=Thalassospira tepidiphila TaxID=393657 RepID=A0A853L3N1_9PROT|nr:MULTISPECIES: acetyltransferase [Thalassospira]MBE72367.1 acetyltransferase [Thalassospira sp.]MBO6577932.1 acetyltransferase [Thalassospira sp.]MBO6817234.1 acetyltransferase [Thalassospira sp.]NJB73921.1 sugar O-acyltransferase (sialic acid O-acetyltransferase NeuD family) [Thalassospira tepidiphila]OAZ11918.1 hypothetical protein TH4_02230 [Thalassospira tepidiphila MCCC 1A03514]|tara:strand:- start:269 stop:907 length:639 start_codon:yes stop_codon:yes gene_type:complete